MFGIFFFMLFFSVGMYCVCDIDHKNKTIYKDLGMENEMEIPIKINNIIFILSFIIIIIIGILKLLCFLL